MSQKKKVMISYADGETHTSILDSEGLKLTVPLSELEGKTICLFFSANSCRPCRSFIPQLIHLYNSVDRRKLEIILVSLDKDEAGFSEHTKDMPWLIAAAAPPPHHEFDVVEASTTTTTTSRRLCDRYCVESIPSLIPLASDGRRVEEDAVQLVEEYGADAFPFGAERRYQLEAMDDAKRRGPVHLQQLLFLPTTPNNNNNYVISRDHGKQIPVADLAGKGNIGLYFGARWCPLAALLPLCYWRHTMLIKAAAAAWRSFSSPWTGMKRNSS
ncbi:putative nucleoredoxin 3 [Iris pallida]|uniref:protein-disulfide reductase n=1 Tax=Iris pallida TaxID=29817 RepID=A0AAX6EJB8_IRIPA|nr:putative nucleoredoxin 3 [Iris pallida]